MIAITDGKIKIDTPHTTLLIRERKELAELLYFGKRLNNITGADLGGMSNRFDAHASVDNYCTCNTLLSFFGDGNDKETFVTVAAADGNFTSKFVYTGHEAGVSLPDTGLPSAHGAEETLALCYEDRARKLLLNVYITVYKNSDVLTFSSALFNLGKQSVRIKRLFSAQIDVDGTEFSVLTLDGRWSNERNIHYNEVSNGTFVIDSKVGSSSNKHNPFIAVNDKQRGDWLAFNPVYSGNHKFEADVSPLGQTRFLSGMNDFMLDYPVGAGESFYAPQTAVVYAETLGEITERMHGFVKGHIIPPRFENRERPVLLNNWEATYFDFTREKLERLTDQAAELGIELFVLDDGWFGTRDNDVSGLGDWVDNTKKTGGLKSLACSVRAKGMKFGLWVEPEMVSPDSDLYRAHPEYAMRLSDSEPIQRRSQLMLDLCNPKAREYVIRALIDVFDECRPDYVKWDCNRVVSEVGSAVLKEAGKYFYDYAKGIYEIIATLTKRYPDTLFESCSAGGNRFDLGMLCYMPQIWCSDDTDARERVKIQSGTLVAYPQSTFGSHVSASPNHQTHHRTPLKERFIVAAAGAFGYELDITKLSAYELTEIREQIAFYKKHRKLLQFGKYRKMEHNPPSFECYTVSSEDGREVMATVIRKSKPINHIPEKIKLGGFAPDKIYQITFWGSDSSYTALGEVLNHQQLDISSELEDNDSNAVSACMIYFESIENRP